LAVILGIADLQQVDPRDPAAPAEAMEAVLEDESLAATLRARGFDHAKRFSWERTARKILQIYRRIAKSR